MSPKESSRIESLEAEIKRLKGKQKPMNHDSLTIRERMELESGQVIVKLSMGPTVRDTSGSPSARKADLPQTRNIIRSGS